MFLFPGTRPGRRRIDGGSKVLQLVDAATIVVDASEFKSFEVTLGGNRTLAFPTGLEDGDQLFWRIYQDGTGSRTLTLASGYKVSNSGAGAITLSTAAGSLDVLAGQYSARTRDLVLVLTKSFS